MPLADYLRLLPGAMAVVGITLCEALLLVRSCSRKHNTKADGDQVLFAYGMASVASGFTGSLVSGPSASRTAAVDAAGSRTQLSSLVAAVTVALVMVFFTEELAYLPTAALAGVVASAVLKLIEVEELRELWQMRRSEFWIAAVCLLSVLVFGPLQAVIIAFLLATIDLLRRASRPGTWVLQEAPDGSHFVPEETDHAPDTSGIIIYRFGAPLYFANATLFEEEVEKLVTQAATPVKWFVLDAEAMVDIDTTGEEVTASGSDVAGQAWRDRCPEPRQSADLCIVGALSSAGIDRGKPAVPDQPPCDRGISPGDGAGDAVNRFPGDDGLKGANHADYERTR